MKYVILGCVQSAPVLSDGQLLLEMPPGVDVVADLAGDDETQRHGAAQLVWNMFRTAGGLANNAALALADDDVTRLTLTAIRLQQILRTKSPGEIRVSGLWQCHGTVVTLCFGDAISTVPAA